MMNICIIPARGGSKRIPRKNIKEFLGKPIIAYSIEAALKSGIFDEVMVSTDDQEIIEVARRYGAKVPFMRSERTANDYATTADVLSEVIECYEQQGQSFDVMCCLYSTAPFVTQDNLRKAYGKLNDNINSCFTMVEYSYPIQRSLGISNGLVYRIHPEYAKSRSQDLEKRYHDAGQFYFTKVSAFKESGRVWGENTEGLVLSELCVQDLDTVTDWKLAEMKYQLLQNA